ncbi:hypothetical protein P7K49_009910 [Saguinus oedipus]|uniref:Uncharacterized protein n=1 Tax=Saguinus oedipus TaxID=9490 RepID=A0ABQ9VLC4_SAGOE|nr:hypothetical protein P7K49_009910 [Saguinus oedipus]
MEQFPSPPARPPSPPEPSLLGVISFNSSFPTRGLGGGWADSLPHTLLLGRNADSDLASGVGRLMSGGKLFLWKAQDRGSFSAD